MLSTPRLPAGIRWTYPSRRHHLLWHRSPRGWTAFYRRGNDDRGRTAGTLSLQLIEAQFDAAGPPHGNEWDLRTIVDGRLHVSKTATGQAVILLEGDATSFGNYGKLPGARHTRGKDVDSGRDFENSSPALSSRCTG